MRPPGSQVRVVRPAFDEARAPERLDVDRARLEEPTLEEAIPRDERVARVSNGDNVPSTGWDLAVTQVTLEGARFTTLWRVEIEAEVSCGFDPRHDARDVVEGEIAARPHAVHHLLEPRRTALGIRGDDDVGRTRDEPETGGEAGLGYQPVHLRSQLRERCRTPPRSLRHYVLTVRFTSTSWPLGSRAGAIGITQAR